MCINGRWMSGQDIVVVRNNVPNPTPRQHACQEVEVNQELMN